MRRLALLLILFTLSTAVVAPASYAQENPCDHPFFPLRQDAYWIYAPAEPMQEGDTIVLRAPVFKANDSDCIGLDCNQYEALWHVAVLEEPAAGSTRVTLETVTTNPDYIEQDTAFFECYNRGVYSLESAAEWLSPPSPFLRGEYITMVSPEYLRVGYSWSGDNYEHAKRGGGMVSIYEWQTQVYTVIDTRPILINNIPRAGLRVLVTTIIVSQGCGYIGVCPDPQATSFSTKQHILTFAEGIGLVELSLIGDERSLRLVETNLAE
jgi:hypothetical protein